MPIIFRDDRLEAKTRRKRRVDFVKAKRAKLKLTQVRGSVLEFVDQFYAFLSQTISFDAWIFRKRKGLCRLHGLSKTNLVKTAFLSILAAVVHVNLLDLIEKGE